LDVDEWMRLAATALAHASMGAAVVAPPRTHRSRFQHLELISTHGAMVLLVLVLQGGLIEQRMLNLDDARSQADLSRVSRWLNDVFAGSNTEEIRQQLAPLPAFEQKVGKIVTGIMDEVDRQEGPLYRDGLGNVLSQPEFVTSANQVLRVFSAGGPLDTVLFDVLSISSPGKSVQIVIGGEGQYADLADFSLVLSRYGVNGYVTGALGVLGPLRMPYARTVSAVRFISQLLSNLVYEIYGHELPPRADE
jgi:heat-inducible transcriptional repressor